MQVQETELEALLPLKKAVGAMAEHRPFTMLKRN